MKLGACRRIAVIGNSCGGKSGLSTLLACALEIPLFSVDRHQWSAGWQRVPDEELTAMHDDFVQQESWLVDGWGPDSTFERRLEQADLVILVAHPLRVHGWWAIKRATKSLFRPDPSFNEGCRPYEMILPNLKIIWDTHRVHLPALSGTLAACSSKLLQIRSPDVLHRFMEQVHRGAELQLRVG
jgi:adenylate kinase family enzyme